MSDKNVFRIFADNPTPEDIERLRESCRKINEALGTAVRKKRSAAFWERVRRWLT